MRKALVELATKRKNAHHPGLLLQKYLLKQSDPDERRALLVTARDVARSVPLQKLYQAAYQRWKDSFAQSGPHASAELATAGRLIVGLGAENVLEAGLRLHHTYGVPIIPGSALKGLAAHYCDTVWGQRHLGNSAPDDNKRFRRKRSENEPEGDYYRLLFGTTEDGGIVTFHDAWIVPESLNAGALRLDVMTPHHPKWQMNEAPPTDFDSPNPVSFLSVAGSFDLRISWSGPAETPPEQAKAWTKLAMKILCKALSEWGVGGKTSSGYGRLVHPSVGGSGPLPNPGERVEAQLLEERTKKGGWRAMHALSGLSGPIQNTNDVPSEKKPGDVLELIVASATKREIHFRYPTPADEARASRAAGKKQGGGKRGAHRR
ncbi:MAG: type III-B CRISPR module RAMP protein Cmr6 [Acetobacteraceae bacterium]|nr:type III-B CRISPR module RAMP protein Cmr6 [Acetobacteraceae bacterium]